MYIDKLYTKLFSDKNWDGLNQLIQEIRVFAMSERDKAANNALFKRAETKGPIERDWVDWKLSDRYGDDYTRSNYERIDAINGMAEARKNNDPRKFWKYKTDLDSMYEDNYDTDGRRGKTAIQGAQKRREESQKEIKKELERKRLEKLENERLTNEMNNFKGF